MIRPATEEWGEIVYHYPRGCVEVTYLIPHMLFIKSPYINGEYHYLQCELQKIKEQNIASNFSIPLHIYRIGYG